MNKINLKGIKQLIRNYDDSIRAYTDSIETERAQRDFLEEERGSLYLLKAKYLAGSTDCSRSPRYREIQESLLYDQLDQLDTIRHKLQDIELNIIFYENELCQTKIVRNTCKYLSREARNPTFRVHSGMVKHFENGIEKMATKRLGLVEASKGQMSALRMLSNELADQQTMEGSFQYQIMSVIADFDKQGVEGLDLQEILLEMKAARTDVEEGMKKIRKVHRRTLADFVTVSSHICIMSFYYMELTKPKSRVPMEPLGVIVDDVVEDVVEDIVEDVVEVVVKPMNQVTIFGTYPLPRKIVVIEFATASIVERLQRESMIGTYPTITNLVKREIKAITYPVQIEEIIFNAEPIEEIIFNAEPIHGPVKRSVKSAPAKKKRRKKKKKSKRKQQRKPKRKFAGKKQSGLSPAEIVKQKMASVSVNKCNSKARRRRNRKQ